MKIISLIKYYDNEKLKEITELVVAENMNIHNANRVTKFLNDCCDKYIEYMVVKDNHSLCNHIYGELK